MSRISVPPTAAEVAALRQWAQEHYVPLDPIVAWWHPTIIEEALRINMAQCRDVLEEEELTEALEAEAFNLSLLRLPRFPSSGAVSIHRIQVIGNEVLEQNFSRSANR